MLYLSLSNPSLATASTAHEVKGHERSEPENQQNQRPFNTMLALTRGRSVTPVTCSNIFDQSSPGRVHKAASCQSPFPSLCFLFFASSSNVYLDLCFHSPLMTPSFLSVLSLPLLFFLPPLCPVLFSGLLPSPSPDFPLASILPVFFCFPALLHYFLMSHFNCSLLRVLIHYFRYIQMTISNHILNRH